MIDYTEPVPDYGDLMTVEEFRAAVAAGYFNDYDGNGEASNGTHVGTWIIYPSEVDKIPPGVTHVVWFNK